MKKWIVGSLVGGLIVFIWGASSWMFLGIHDGEMKYTPAQDQIMAVLQSNLQEDGSYYIPGARPDLSQKEKQELMKSMGGKPWAWIHFGKSKNTDMVGSMVRGFILDIILVVLLISILVRGGLPRYWAIVSGAIAVGLFSFLWGPYNYYNWFSLSWTSIQGQLIDAVAAWGLCGLWLGWWLRRPSHSTA
jgi:hypothetical protein